MSWESTFTVEGATAFPLDMLRFDECWPVTPDDAALIEQTLRHENNGRVRIKLGSAKSTYYVPTARRWDSFLWKIVAMDGRPS